MSAPENPNDNNSPPRAIASDTPAGSSGQKPARLRSLDALRGFDMFWIVGGHTLITNLAKFTEWEWLRWFAGEFHHSGWTGFTLYDLIFPLFLFLAGVSMPYSLGRQIEQGQSKAMLVRKVAIRAFLLVLLGFIYNGGLAFKGVDETRFASVLGLIGVAYFSAALIFINSDTRHQVIWILGILLGYWAALEWVSVPGFGAGVITEQGSIRTFFDRAYLPGKFSHGTYDAEGILSMISATTTALLGGLTGQFIRHAKLNKFSISGVLLAASGACYLLGQLWGTQLEISKLMWNPPFVFHCAGWSLLLLSLFYFVIDALGFWRWSYFFIVIGVNSITVYLGVRLINFHQPAGFLFNGLVNKFGTAEFQTVLSSLAYILTWWMILLYMYRKKIFLRV